MTVDGESITYDASGNPTSYYNGTEWDFTWEQGRRLVTATDGTTSLSFTYDADGLRTSKTVDGVKHTYLYASGKLLRETYGNNTLDFFYDTNGHPYALSHEVGDAEPVVYYYITNLQGDVMSIVDEQGAVVACYEYDPYGNVTCSDDDLAEINPLRYRGYYYDGETGMYYLQSRYYDPELGRFINADVYASTGQGILGNNMFAYCRNSPVCHMDVAGTADFACYYDDGKIQGSNDFTCQGGGGVGSAVASLAYIYVASQLGYTDSKIKTNAVATVGTSSEDKYSVYFLYAEGGNPQIIVYVGRVKTENFASRMAYHKTQGRLLSGSIDGLDYALCRAIEQGGMMYHHTINRGNNLMNQIRGIGPTNGNRFIYIDAILDLFNSGKYPENSLLPASYWANFTENEFLNLGS